MTEQETSIENIFEALNKSPLYNLSMCSLENFHTNFLVWLGKTYPQQTLDLLANCIENDDIKEWKNIEFVTQESLGKDCKFDLCVKSKDNAEGKSKPKVKRKAKDSKILLVLENKIKSYPTEEQLEKYNKKFGEETVKILLTLFPFELPEENKTWNIIDYSKLSGNLKSIFIDDKNLDKGDYHKNLIDDYYSVISKISDLVVKADSQAEKNNNHQFVKYDIYKIANNLKDFHDVYVKYRTADLKNYLKDKIQNEEISFSETFNDKQGTINIENEYFKGFKLSIQIQGSQYRYCLIYGNESDKDNRYYIAEKLSEDGFWFSGYKGEYSENKKEGVKIEYNNARLYKEYDKPAKYCGYSPDFIYQYMPIDANRTYKSIAEQVKSDIEHLCKKQEAIQNAYNEFPTSDKA